MQIVSGNFPQNLPPRRMPKNEPAYVRFQQFVARCCLLGEQATGLPIRDAIGRLPVVGIYRLDEGRDTLLASFPRSGNTWVRAIIACAILGRPLRSLTEIDYYVPDVHPRTPRCLIRKSRSGSVVKTHRTAEREPLSMPAIFIYREPLAVAWSFYSYLCQLGKLHCPFGDYLRDFLLNETGRMSWIAHTRSWLQRANNSAAGPVAKFSYEELCQQPVAAAERLLSFLTIEVETRDAERLVSWTTSDMLKKAEEVGNRRYRTGWFIKGSDRSAMQLNSADFRALEQFYERNGELFKQLILLPSWR
jgi:hypothetical protein